MRTLCKALLPLFALVLPVAVSAAPASATLVTPCQGRFLGPTFAPNGGYAYCSGGGTQTVNAIRVMLKCQGDTSWRYGPFVYNMGQSSVLYCPTGKLASQVSVQLS